MFKLRRWYYLQYKYFKRLIHSKYLATPNFKHNMVFGPKFPLFMPKIHTRESSRGNLQYQDLSFSNPRRKARVSLSPVRSTPITHTPIRSISTLVVRSQPRIPSSNINRSLAYMARAHAFSTFNGGSSLLLA